MIGIIHIDYEEFNAANSYAGSYVTVDGEEVVRFHSSSYEMDLASCFTYCKDERMEAIYFSSSFDHYLNDLEREEE